MLVLTDQHRADLCAREGYGIDTTPFLDALARSGQWFDRAYTTAPLCCPARTSLMTGRWPSAHRVRQNPAAGQAVHAGDLPGVCRDAGYATAMIGKNHTYLGPDRFDAWVEFMHDGQLTGERSAAAAGFDGWLTGLRHRTPLEPAPYGLTEQQPYRIVDAALHWVASVPADRPLLLVVSFPEPHNPYQVPEPYFSRFAADGDDPMPAPRTDASDRPGGFPWAYLRALGEAGHPDYAEVIDRARTSYAGMLRLIDDQVAALYAGLERRSRPRLSMITADHGDFVGEYGLVRKGAELPELLARIPLILTGTGIPAGGPAPRSDHVSIADLFPTVCAAIGQPVPFGVQGRSLWPMITGRPYRAEDFASVYVEQGMGGEPYDWSDVSMPASMPGLFHDGPHGEARFDELNAATQSGQRRKVRRGDHVLYADNTGAFRLHDLGRDPFELEDRWDDPDLAAVRDRLLRDLVGWQLRVEDRLPAVPDGYPLKISRDRGEPRSAVDRPGPDGDPDSLEVE